MSTPYVVPAKALPTKVSGSRSTLWWGMALLIVIELTVFSALLVSYFYFKSELEQWPPGGIERPKLLLPTVNTVIIFGSSAAIYWADRGIKRGNQRHLMIGLVASFVLGAIFLTIKAIEYSDYSYNWATNVYGSIVWTITGFHSGHVLGVLLKTLVLIALAWQGYFDADRHLGVQINGLYWHFVVVIWIPIYFTLYLSPYLL